MLRFTNFFLLFFFTLFILSCNNDQAPETTEIPPQTDTVAAPTLPAQKIYSGQIQSSGLRRSEVETIGLGNIGFQLLGDENYFLVWDSVMQNHWGDCVEITGDEIADSTTQKTNLYGRKILKVKTLKPFSGPCIYASDSIDIPADKMEILSGKVKRVFRPAPDISYDYELILDKPYWETGSAFADKLLVKSIVLTAAKNQVAQLENAIDSNQSVQIEGAKIHGYAESIVFAVKSVTLPVM